MQNNVLQYLEASAERYPDKCAAIDEACSLTYAELLDECRRIGSALVRAGATGRSVIVMAEKSVHSLAVQLGAVYAGAFYVPVSPMVSEGHLAKIACALGETVVVCDQELSGELRAVLGASHVLSLAELSACDVDEAALAAVRERALETDPVYTLFTSGSTGEPKGVVISHRAIVSFIDSFVSELGIRHSDRIGNQAPFDFDVSTKDIYSTLACGATLVIVPRRLFMRPVELVRYLSCHRVTVLIWAVAALCIVSAYHALGEANLGSLRLVMFSGEVMPQKHLRAWRSGLPGATFVNLYGPTEITCNCLYHVLDPNRDYADGIPLGRPFAHCDVVLLGEANARLGSPGDVGEMLVRGPSLALGYLGRPDLTARAFTQNPTNAAFPDRVYRTGDLAQVNDRGELVFSGRRDNQVKYQGHRIELEEVDLAFERAERIERCRCVFDARRRRLHAFYEGAAGVDEVAAYARESLPSHMRPTIIRRVSDMPLNKNGKVDRHALLASL